MKFRYGNEVIINDHNNFYYGSSGIVIKYIKRSSYEYLVKIDDDTSEWFYEESLFLNVATPT